MARQELIKLGAITLGDTRGLCHVAADGYHRLCAVYTFAEDALIPCKIV